MGDITLEGAIAVLTTPNDGSNNISEEILRSHVKDLWNNGIRTFISTGGTGEIETLSVKQRRDVSRIVKDELDAMARGAEIETIAGKDYFFGVGTGAGDTRTVIDYTNYAEELKADFVMIRPPAEAKFNATELRQYYLDVIDSTASIPIMLYAPYPEVTVDLIKELSEYEQVRWVKEATGEIDRVKQIQEACGDNIEVVCGSDSLAYEMAVEHGVKAWVAPPVNVYPNACALLYELIKTGKGPEIAEAEELNTKLKPMFNLFEEKGIYVEATKAAMEMIHKSCGNPFKIEPLSGGDKSQLSDIVAELTKERVEELAEKRRIGLHMQYPG